LNKLHTLFHVFPLGQGATSAPGARRPPPIYRPKAKRCPHLALWRRIRRPGKAFAARGDVAWLSLGRMLHRYTNHAPSAPELIDTR
jgi:hypothetical protein